MIRYMILGLFLVPSLALALEAVLQIDGQTIRSLKANKVNVTVSDQRTVIDVRTESKPTPTPPSPDPFPIPDPPSTSSNCKAPNGFEVPLTINWRHPGGQVLCDVSKSVAWPFTTTSNPAYQGQVSLVEASSRGGMLRLWISATVGGPPLGDRCSTTGRESAVVRWAQSSVRGTCQLSTNSRYFVNVEYIDCKFASCLFYRNIYTNQRP